MTTTIATNYREFISAISLNPHARCEAGDDGHSIKVISQKDKLAAVGTFFSHPVKALFKREQLHNEQALEVAKILKSWGLSRHRDNADFNGFGSAHLTSRVAHTNLKLQIRDVITGANGGPGVVADAIAKARKWELRVWASDKGLGANATIADAIAVNTGSVATLNVSPEQMIADPELAAIANKRIFLDFNEDDYNLLARYAEGRRPDVTTLETQTNADGFEEVIQKPARHVKADIASDGRGNEFAKVAPFKMPARTVVTIEDILKQDAADRALVDQELKNIEHDANPAPVTAQWAALTAAKPKELHQVGMLHADDTVEVRDITDSVMASPKTFDKASLSDHEVVAEAATDLLTAQRDGVLGKTEAFIKQVNLQLRTFLTSVPLVADSFKKYLPQMQEEAIWGDKKYELIKDQGRAAVREEKLTFQKARDQEEAILLPILKKANADDKTAKLQLEAMRENVRHFLKKEKDLDEVLESYGVGGTFWHDIPDLKEAGNRSIGVEEVAVLAAKNTKTLGAHYDNFHTNLTAHATRLIRAKFGVRPDDDPTFSTKQYDAWVKNNAIIGIYAQFKKNAFGKKVVSQYDYNPIFTSKVTALEILKDIAKAAQHDVTKLTTSLRDKASELDDDRVYGKKMSDEAISQEARYIARTLLRRSERIGLLSAANAMIDALKEGRLKYVVEHAMITPPPEAL